MAVNGRFLRFFCKVGTANRYCNISNTIGKAYEYPHVSVRSSVLDGAHFWIVFSCNEGM